jgi:hypothetical protein
MAFSEVSGVTKQKSRNSTIINAKEEEINWT